MSTPNAQDHAKIPLERDDQGHPRFHGCSNFRVYEVLGKLGEGTFGEVYRARSQKNGKIFALKKILMHNEKDGFPITALREIKLLKMLSHVNVLTLEEMAVEKPKGDRQKKSSMYMVTPYMEHDLSGLLENPSVQFSEPQIKCYMLQLLEGIRYLHANRILHRDMKAANLLINNKGILQIADFGLARPYDDPPPEPGKGGGDATRDYTSLVVTRWYRPPELLLQLRRYTTAIDMWGVGCVFGEMFKRKPILTGNSDLQQIQLIFELVGSPTEERMPGWNTLPGCDGITSFPFRTGNLPQVFREQGSLMISLLSELLKLDWRKRINAIDALQHPYFKTAPLPANPGDLPKFEDSHELDRRKFRGQKAALPPAPAGGSVGMGPDGEGNETGPGRRGGLPRSQHHYNKGQGSHLNGNALPYPPRGHDNRPPNIHDQRVPGGQSASDRRPAWQRGEHTLPPRPPDPIPQRNYRRGSAESYHDDRRPRQRGPRDNRDSYIPNYGDANNGARPPRDDGLRRDDRPDRERYGRRQDVEYGDYRRRRSRSPERRERPRDWDRLQR